MKQRSFIPPSKKEHGGSLSIGKRRSRRPLSAKHPIHITLKSELATGPRSLLRNRKMINAIITKWAQCYRISLYQKALAGNHLHLLIRGKTRIEIQNFFRVVSGHIAQEILRQFPLKTDLRGGNQSTGKESIRNARSAINNSKKPQENQSNKRRGCLKNQRKFWDLLVYSRILTWGREFKTVSVYIFQNTLEALNLVAYRPRSPRSPRVRGDNTA